MYVFNFQMTRSGKQPRSQGLFPERRETENEVAVARWREENLHIVISFLNRKDGAIFPTRSGELVPRQDLVFSIYATIFMVFFKLQNAICYFEGPKCQEWSTIRRLFILAILISLIVSIEKTQMFESFPIRPEV